MNTDEPVPWTTAPRQLMTAFPEDVEAVPELLMNLLSQVGSAVEDHVREQSSDWEDAADLDGVMMANAEVRRAITALANKLRLVSPVDLAAIEFVASEGARPALLLTQGDEPSDPRWPVWRRIA